MWSFFCMIAHRVPCGFVYIINTSGFCIMWSAYYRLWSCFLAVVGKEIKHSYTNEVLLLVVFQLNATVYLPTIKGEIFYPFSTWNAGGEPDLPRRPEAVLDECSWIQNKMVSGHMCVMFRCPHAFIVKTFSTQSTSVMIILLLWCICCQTVFISTSSTKALLSLYK